MRRCHDGKPWWKDAVFYQVYPASFKDSNGDGWGDIPGLVSKIDYLAELGVDVIWLSPMYESPQKDMGYDVSDYQSVYSRYGTLRDVDALISACHARGMKLILDLVVNHTSDQHRWFLESRSSKTNPKRDWYIWKPPRFSPSGGGERLPPTNWRGYFATSTWTWDEQTQEYYLHLYHSSQPDLNWENPACRRAIYDEAVRFWLDRGVDGFRIDTVNKYSKVTSYPDAPVVIPGSPIQPAPEMWCNGPRIHEFLREMRAQVLGPRGAVSVGELSNTPDPEQVMPYVSAAAGELDMAHEFSTIRLGTGGNIFQGKYLYEPFGLPALKRSVEKWQVFTEGTDGWHTAFIENHDNGRAVSRFGDDSAPEPRAASAKVIALWQATLTGTLFLYQGQEIGMSNMPRDWKVEDEYKDVESLGFYKEALESGDEERLRRTAEGLRILARDHARLPFQWDDSPNAGFTADGVKPWMRVHDGFREVNAEQQMQDPGSVLSFYKKVLKLRKEHGDLFIHGRFRLLLPEDESLFVYVKESADHIVGPDAGTKRRAVVVLNFSSTERRLPDVGAALGLDGQSGNLLITTFGEHKIPSEWADTLRAWEGRVYLNFYT
ncbi:glycoside hydrolase superfamily [Cladorrhinum samala]|uniref:Glycoside hydrolase superfamily n=1 Tax=Cladorrhinum samala TaxID=585594 RepID=A0AAV9HXP3_9PEZI|nr:glycoside hydrolase superfamily [Cladorrhinum samala]